MVSSSAQAVAAADDSQPGDAAGDAADGRKPDGKGAGFTGTYRLLVRGKNINGNTLLATDYLNHFNEIIMLLEMIPSMPECYEDAITWQPKSYADHFRDSCFSDAELAILAYENAPQNYRQAFDATIEQMDRLVLEALPRIKALVEAGEEGPLQAGILGVTRKLQSFVDVASSIINGNMDTLDQAQIDKVMNG
ncbi:hypothetical protein [Pelagibius marinus]|uniref:hypothetical protein n=1 Tax=Pelagibius marinus TaxID=2762760 RepID=UPI001D04DDEB|nr:hypothetical protein [Pelagibius marinus]